MFPKYQEIQIPLLYELKKRGGTSRPSDKNEDGKNIYEAIADEFGLTEDLRSILIYEADGTPRSKWENMVRWTRNDLKKKNFLDSPSHGVWKITDLGIALIESIDNERIGSSIFNIDLFVSPEKFAKQKARMEEIGKLGEDYVYQREISILREIGREDLANAVKMICKENVAAGYDILSFTEDGEEKYIEVKTTTAFHYRFELTANELSKAGNLGDSCWIYRVTKIQTGAPEIMMLQNPAKLIEESKLILKPTSFLVSLSENYGD